jgi:calcium/proton exchanger cax
LNVSFGNAAELMLALFVLSAAQTRIVQAQITGSIIGTALLFLGISAFVGGIGRARQSLSRSSAGLLPTLLFLVLVAVLLPAVFDLTQRITAPEANIARLDERLSLGVSVVLLLIYAASLVYTLITNRNVFSPDAAGGAPEWSVGRALAGRELTRRGRLSDDVLALIATVPWCGNVETRPTPADSNQLTRSPKKVRRRPAKRRRDRQPLGAPRSSAACCHCCVPNVAVAATAEIRL